MERPLPRSPRRSFLFTPGDDRHKVAKTAGLDADVVVLDLEDAVATDRKGAARETMVAALYELDFGRAERLVRLNAANSPFFEADLAALAQAEPDGVVLPKVETAAALADLDARLTAAERERGRQPGSTRLFPLVETPLGVMNLREIAGATPRVDALLFGAEDLAAALGARRTRAGTEVALARAAVVLAAAAFGVPAIDMVYTDLGDLDGLEVEAVQARDLGYLGKLAIHPRQLSVINRVFTPAEEDVEAAQGLLDAYAQWRSRDVGVFSLDGRMVDRPMVVAAERLVARARLCARE